LKTDQLPLSSAPSRAFPFVSLATALTLLRVSVAIFFMAHATVRLVTGTIPGFGGFLEARGWPQGVLLVWCITLYELAGGLAMALGWRARWAALGLFFIAGMGIVIIHAQLGWFVGEHGTGGMEYSLALMVALLVIAAADAEAVAARAARAG
jgi:putative oxidoreductase